FATFLFSTLSHVIFRQPVLNTLRAWDQAMIYAMISGTYTPIAYAYATDRVRAPLLALIWLAAGAGFLFKVVLRYRINSIGTISYLLLGWLPAIPLAPHVPSGLAWAMLLGGLLYSLGVLFLLNDRKVKYMHAAWHLCVMMAASCHYLAIWSFVVRVA
ncbi:MAG: hemolysin III family protein, partial [Pirellulales bacterium]|nr:hemolysin III family protein [Pirellulales bacterium]